MKANRRKPLFFSTSAIFCILVYWIAVSHFSAPSYLKAEDYSSEPLETREYAFISLPREGNSFGAYYDQIKWHLTKPGQVRLHETAGAPGVVDFKSALEHLGYKFPEGTSISQGCLIPITKIRHHPTVLDHIERYLKLERKQTSTTP